jgi:Excalibur calcium-binding domain
MRARLVALIAVLSLPIASAQTSAAFGSTLAAPPLFKNCTNLNKRYPHGVGRVGARDRTTGDDPVTNFKRSNRIYKVAMSWNKGLDRDKDGIACEQA